jgi:GMP synthase-like glutamine amidotransferase
MKIGILECGHAIEAVAENHGDFAKMFERLLDGNGFNYASYDVENMEFPEDIHACDGWLLTGSKHGAYENHPFIPPLTTFICEAYAAAVPLVGICFGHQLIAQALGGHVEKFDGGWALGLNEYKFDGLGTMKLNAWHQDQVVKLPQGAKPIASNSFCENAALVYDKRALTIQPHPEFHGKIIDQYVDLRRGTSDYPDDLMDTAKAHASDGDNNSAMATQIAEFFKTAKGENHV